MPPETTDVNTEAESSTASTDGKDVTADSSTVATTDVKEKTLGDVVAEAAEKSSKAAEQNGDVRSADSTDGEAIDEDKEDTSSENEETKTETETEAETETETKTKTDKVVDATKTAADEKLPFAKHPRFQQLLKQSKDATTELERAKPLAQQATNLNEYCQKNRIAPDQLQEALALVALLNQDPSQGRAKLAAALDNLDTAMGLRLPADLADKVEKGVMTQEDAKAWAQDRLAKDAARSGVENATRSNAQAIESAKVSALNSWDQSKRTSDPDFKPKSAEADVDGKWEFVLAKLQHLSITAPPKTPEDAIRIAERAYAEVNKAFARLRPPAKRTRNLTSNGSSTTAEAAWNPKSLKDVVRGVAEGRKLAF